MAAKTQRGAREAIQNLSSILTDCAVPKVPSESFRQAKFNRNEATSILWTLLLNIVQLVRFLESKSSLDEMGDSLKYFSLSPSSSDRNNWKLAILVVKKFFLSMEYTRTQFYCTQFGSGSRELLMAFGWLLHKSELIKKLCVYHLKAASTTSIPFRTTQMFVVRGMVDESDDFQTEISQIVSHLSEVLSRERGSSTKYQSGDALDKVDETLKKLAWLRGKLLAKWNATLNSKLAYVKQAHRLNRSTLTQKHSSGDGRYPHLNVHELFLLRYPDHLSSYLKKAEHHMVCLQRLIQWRILEPVFWQWMESVLDLDEREKASSLEEHEQPVEDKEEASVKASNAVVEYQLESLDSLTKKVEALEKKVLGVIEKHKPYLEKIQRVWQLKAKSVDFDDVEREHVLNKNKLESLLLRTEQDRDLQLKLIRIKEATSSVGTLTQEDRAIFVAETEKGARRPTKSVALAAFPTPLQLQQSANSRLLEDSRQFYRHILSELDKAQSLIQQHREGIIRQLHMREENLPTSVYKIDKRSLLS